MDRLIRIGRHHSHALSIVGGVVMAILAFIAISAAVSSYISHYVAAGPVVQRSYHPAHFETYMSYEYYGQDCTISADGVSRCESQYHFVPRTRWVPDAWSLKVEGHCVLDKQGIDKCDQTWHSVTEEQYNQSTVGAWYGPTPSPSFRY